jgi:stage V sporulation protein R
VSSAELARLARAEQRILGIAAGMGLNFLPQEFDVVSEQKMLEIMAYRLPVNFSHWSFGRDFEIERTRHAHGYAVPYEVVFNSDPVRAYLMESNPYPIQVLVMAHVYAHNDFMKNNRHFQHSRRDMIAVASEAAARFRRYEQDYGRDEVERLIDAGLAIQWNIDPEEPIHGESEQAARERLFGWAREPAQEGGFDDLLPDRPAVSAEEKRELRLKTPPEPTLDLLGYIIEHSPRPLVDWQKDVLGTIKSQALYFLPYRRTKIMNEGWATYWHQLIMQRLFQEGFLSSEEHGFYNLYNARVKAHLPRQLNPYLLGFAVFQDLKQRWDRGRHGPAYEELEEERQRQSWDLASGQGTAKLFEVRRTYMDWFFLEEFLKQELMEELGLYVYLEKDRGTHYDAVVEATDWREVKRLLVRGLMNSGVPRVRVVDGNYRDSLQLYLVHEFEGLPLQEDYCVRTLEHIHRLWRRPVLLESRELDGERMRRKLFIVDESGVRVNLD